MKKFWTPGPQRLEDGLLEARCQSESGARRQRKWRGGPEPSKNNQPSPPGPVPFLCTSEDSFAFVLIFFCTPWLTPTERCPCPSSFPSCQNDASDSDASSPPWSSSSHRPVSVVGGRVQKAIQPIPAFS